MKQIGKLNYFLKPKPDGFFLKTTMNENTETIQTDSESVGQRIDPILEHLEIEDADIDKSLIRKRFIDIWEYEKGNDLDEEGQYLTTVAAFIYNGHNGKTKKTLINDGIPDFDNLPPWYEGNTKIEELNKRLKNDREGKSL